MAAHGFRDLWGFDPYVTQDWDHGAVHVRRAGVNEMPQRAFRVVMFNHALEHMATPGEVLLRARERLEPGGAILVRVPIASSLADRLYGTDWVALDAPRHLHIPSIDGMRFAAARASLRVRRIFYESYGFQFWGSEQYRRGIPLRGERSVASGSSDTFTPADVETFERLALELDRRGQGDGAGFVLSP
jgi:hypothetical protein